MEYKLMRTNIRCFRSICRQYYAGNYGTVKRVRRKVMKDKVKKVHIEKVFIFLLFTIFAGAVVIVLSLGANIYKSLVERDNAAYEKHLGTGYIAAKIHGNDRKDAIAIGGFVNEKQDDGIKTLHIYEKIEGEWYDTRIYYYDGAIREVFTFREMKLLRKMERKLYQQKIWSYQLKEQKFQFP